MKPRPVIVSKSPPGFEHLLAPQTALVDLYFQGRRLTSAMATFAPGRFELQNPGAVVDFLPAVLDRDRVRNALTGSLRPNSALLCGDIPDAECGRLEPDVAGVIFDAGRFRADLFVNPGLISAADRRKPVYLPVPDAGVSVLQSIGGAFAGNSNADTSYNIGSFTLLGHDEKRLRAETTVSDDDGFAVDQLAGEWERPGWLYRSGLFRAAAVPILGDRPFYGIGVNSSADTRMDRDRIEGSKLMVFLSRRAQVDILREGRLLSSQSYAPGNQALDTSTLPSGAYDVTVRIREAGGAIREERRFFSKSSLIPPADVPRYVVELGVLAGTDFAPFPTPGDDPVLHAGTTHRLVDGFALGADATLSTETMALEIDAHHQSKWTTVSLGGFGATNGAFGAVFNGYASLDRFSYSVSVRRIWSDDVPLDERDDTELLNLFSGSSTQATFNLGYTFADGPRVSFGGFWRHDDGVGDTYSLGPSLVWPVYHDRGMRIDFLADAAYGSEETLASARFRIFWDRPSHHVNASAGYQHTLDENGPTGRGFRGHVDGRWRDQDLVPGDLQLGGALETDPRGSLARLAGEYQGPRARGSSRVERDIDGDHATRYSGDLFFNVVGNDGKVTWSGNNASRSGVIIAVEGDTGAEFDVLVGGQPRGRVGTGETLPLLLPEYRLHAIRLKPVNAPSVHFDSRARTVSLYPGTIKTLRWRVRPVVTVFGRIVGPAGLPMADAKVDGALGPVFTDAEGYFQAEVSRRSTLRVLPAGRPACDVTFDVTPSRKDFVALDRLVCR